MATARSVAGGIGLAASGVALGYFSGSSFDYLTSIGRVAYLNEITTGAADICRLVGYVGGPLVGAYHAFFSDAATPCMPTNQAQPRNPANININVRGGRNNFRF